MHGLGKIKQKFLLRLLIDDGSLICDKLWLQLWTEVSLWFDQNDTVPEFLCWTVMKYNSTYLVGDLQCQKTSSLLYILSSDLYFRILSFFFLGCLFLLLNISSQVVTFFFFFIIRTGLSFYTSEKTLRAAFEGFGELVQGTLCNITKQVLLPKQKAIA